jgi:acyl-coenzyme A thioesterase PaaI-like protein
MHAFRKLAKWTAVLAPATGLAYLANHYNSMNEHHIHLLPGLESQLSPTFQRYISENNLTSPELYQNFQKKYKFDHFWEKGILKDLKGLVDYNIFIDRTYNDILVEDKELSKEDKQKLHSEAKIHCTFKTTSKLQGNADAVHSGFISTLFDNVSGCLAFMACDLNPAVTAYLNVNYEKPVTVDQEYVAVIEVEKVQGRKVFLKGKIVDKDNNVCTTMESLFIKAKWDNFYLKNLYRSLLLDKKVEKITKKADEKAGVAGLVKSINGL